MPLIQLFRELTRWGSLSAAPDTQR